MADLDSCDDLEIKLLFKMSGVLPQDVGKLSSIEMHVLLTVGTAGPDHRSPMPQRESCFEIDAWANPSYIGNDEIANS